ncbi:MAG: BamA/TamA family outer membrane protein [Longimicrobiales bacterium]
MRYRLILPIALLLGAGRLDAQQAPPFAELPDSVAERVVAFYNAPGTIRLSGESLVAAGTEIAGPVAVLGGPLTLAGRVQGDLVVINGDLRLDSDAVVSGFITVVGGAIDGLEGATVSGRVSHYREPLRFRHEGGGLVYVRPIEPELSAGREFGFGRTDLLIAVRGAYNRVEGLPISIGPRIRLGRSNPTFFEGLLIYRSSTGLRFDPDDVGYAVRAEQYVAGGRTARIGLRAYSEVTPIEQWGLSDRENSLSTFILHRDYRDAYESRGWASYLRFARPGWPHDLTVEYRHERHRLVRPASPLSLFDNQEGWRPEPVIAAGRLQSITARLAYDTRNDEVDPSAGWHILAEVEQGLGGRLNQEVTVDLEQASDTTLSGVGSRERFTAALFDFRRYLRLGPDSRLSVRVVGAGSVDGTALPPQRQQTLGGEASMPGFALFEFDCGARSVQVEVDGEPFFPFYGCDRLGLLQLEYQSGFPFAGRLGNYGGLDIGQMMRWVVFFDAGRAWTESGDRRGRLPGDGDVSADAGVGLRIGRIGAYWAVPITGGGQGVNFFVRIGRRI